MSNNFEHKSLSQLCTLLNGLAFKPEDWSEYGHPIIRIQNLNGSSDFNFCNRPVPNQYMIPPDTVLFSWSGNRGTSFGPYWWKGSSGVLNQHIFKVSPKPDIYPRWLYYSLDLARQEAEQQAHGGSGLVHVRRTDLLKYKIPTPPPPEQRRIAEILDTIDEAIQKTEALISKLKVMKQGLFHDLFTRGLDENGKLRDPKAHPEQFKDSSFGRIPEEWKIKQCQAVCKGIGAGIVIKPAQYYQSSGIPVFRSANIQESGIYPEDLVYMSEQSNRLLAKSQIHTGDVLTVRTGYPGTSCFVPSEFDGANCVDLLISRPAPIILPEFLSLWINSSFGKGQVLRMQGGLAQQHFNVGELEKLLVPIPILREQSGIVKNVEAHDTRIRTEEQYRDKLKLQKKGLMHDLLTGKAGVKV